MPRVNEEQIVSATIHVPAAKSDQGDATGHAICSGCAAEMIDVWPGVSISWASFGLSSVHEKASACIPPLRQCRATEIIVSGLHNVRRRRAL